MPDPDDVQEVVKCSFCGKASKQVGKLIAGPGVYICNECVELCVDIIREEGLVRQEGTSVRSASFHAVAEASPVAHLRRVQGRLSELAAEVAAIIQQLAGQDHPEEP